MKRMEDGKKGAIDKKGIVWDQLIPWIIAIGILILVIGIYVVLKAKGGSALDYLKVIFRFGR